MADNVVPLRGSNKDGPTDPNQDRAFALLAESVLQLLRGTATGDMGERALAFYAAERAAGDGGSGRGVPIRLVDFTRAGEDDATNTIIRGVLQMVSALVVDPSRNSNQDDYQRGVDEMVAGVAKLNAKIASRGR